MLNAVACTDEQIVELVGKEARRLLGVRFRLGRIYHDKLYIGMSATL